MKKVFENQTSDSTVEVTLNRGDVNTIFVKGDFDGAIIAVEFSPDDGVTWFRDSTDNITSESIRNIDVSNYSDYRCRIVLEGADTSTSITVFFG